MVNKAGKPVVKNALRKRIVDEYKQLLSAPTDPESLQRLRGLLTAARQVEPGVFPTIHKFAFPNSAYFYNHGGYEFAKQFYANAYQAAIKIVGGEQYIVSAVMHADERNRGMSDKLGEDVYHYHMHVVYVPVVQTAKRWSKRCKDPSLVGTIKEIIPQVARTKKWDSKQAVDENGQPLFDAKGNKVIRPSYSVLQDDFYNFMRNAGYTDVQRGERGSTEEHLTVTQFKVEQEQKRLAALQAESHEKELDILGLEELKAQAEGELQDATLEVSAAQDRLSELTPRVKDSRTATALGSVSTANFSPAETSIRPISRPTTTRIRIVARIIVIDNTSFPTLSRLS